MARVLEDLHPRVVPDQALVAGRVVDRDEQVVAPPDDQHRDLDRREAVAVGVLQQRLERRHEARLAEAEHELLRERDRELLGVADGPLHRRPPQPRPPYHRLLEALRVRQPGGHEPRQRQRRLARDLLGREPRRRHEHQPVHARVERQRELGADEAAHRAADDGDALDAERVAHRVDGLRIALDRDRLGRHLRRAEARQVERDAAVRVHERRDVEQEDLPVRAPAVQEQQRRARLCPPTKSAGWSRPYRARSPAVRAARAAAAAPASRRRATPRRRRRRRSRPGPGAGPRCAPPQRSVRVPTPRRSYRINGLS